MAQFIRVPVDTFVVQGRLDDIGALFLSILARK